MSTFKVEICQIDTVTNHPNADRLEIVKLKDKDWTVVTQKGLYSAGDAAVYFPIDTLLPKNIEFLLFPIESKVKLHNSRIKTIKLRGAISQGMIARPSLLGLENHNIGSDVTKQLNITKYEPISKLSSNTKTGKVTIKQTNPHFRKYTSIENAKNYSNIFQEGEEVSITEKCHGTNARFGYVPFHANTILKKLKKFLGIAPEYEFVYGSHNVQLQDRLLHKGYYGNTIGNVYAETVVNYKLKDSIPMNTVVYGEIYGDGIQKGYTYGCKQGERKLALFDVMIDGKYLDAVSFRKWAQERDLPIVPELYRGPFNKEKILQLRDGNSVLCPSQKDREGVVVKPLKEETCYIGRKMLKYISDLYLLKNQDLETEPH